MSSRCEKTVTQCIDRVRICTPISPVYRYQVLAVILFFFLRLVYTLLL